MRKAAICSYNKGMQEVILQNEFRTFVLEEMERQKLSQGELARRMGVARPSVTQYLNGSRSPGMDVVERFYAALGFQPRLTAEPATKPVLQNAS